MFQIKTMERSRKAYVTILSERERRGDLKIFRLVKSVRSFSEKTRGCLQKRLLLSSSGTFFLIKLPRSWNWSFVLARH